LKKFKKYFKGWGFNIQGARKKLCSQLRGELLTLEQIEEINTLTLDQINRKVQINTQLLDMLVDDELYWLKRSHENWLHKGDINTDYFHRVANGRRKNTILSLCDNNSVIEGDENLLEHATKYYKELFGPGVGNVFQMDPGLWKDGEKVTDEDNHTLTQPFSEEEVKQALFQMEQNKASGPDCIPIEFYQKCWGIIKQEIMEMFSEFYEGNLNVNRINYGVITLLPKFVDANKIQQYRPICLLNCLYKLITKVITIRLEKLAEKLILSNQTAFMKGRNIMTGVMALHEVMHETKRKGQTAIVLKLDFEKAYDKFCWNFLFSGLAMRGFCQRWCDWIKQVVTGGTVCVKINNKMGPYFTSHKGVKQGDPLSPILFNFAADCLTRMIREVQDNGLIVGLADHLIARGVAVLQYADDTIICLKDDDDDDARNMKILLYLYEMMSGLKINFSKSEVIMINGDDERSIQIAEMFNCQIGLFPIKYLGVPVSPSRLHVKDWMPIVEKMKRN
jgi:hypothetical protein